MIKNEKLEKLKKQVFEEKSHNRTNALFKMARSLQDIETIERLSKECNFIKAIDFLNKTQTKTPKILSTINKSLLLACQEGDINIVKQLLSNSEIDINAESQGLTPLILAYNYPDIVELLIKNGADINKKTLNGYTALIAATREGVYNTVKLLLDFNADINLPLIMNGISMTPLITAIENNHLNIVELLLANNCDINIKFGEHDALQFALIKNNLEIIETIIKSRAKEINLAELLLAVDNIHFVELAIKNGVNINSKSEEDELTVLEMSCISEEINYIELLIDNNTIEIQPDHGGKALCLAITHDKINSVKLLIENEAHINYQWDNGFTPLMLAVYHQNYEITSFLLENKAQINMQNDGGDTALMHAVSNESLDILNLLLSFSPDLNIQNKNGTTALMIAVSSKKLPMTEALLKAGTNTQQRAFEWHYDDNDEKEVWGDSGHGDTALIVACRDNDFDTNDNLEIIKCLLTYTNEINSVEAASLDVLLFRSDIAKIASSILVDYDDFKMSMLMYVIHMGYAIYNVQRYMGFGNQSVEKREKDAEEFLEYNILVKCKNLLEAGVDLNYSSDGETALSLAKEHGLEKVVELINIYLENKITKTGFIAFEDFILTFTNNEAILVNTQNPKETKKLNEVEKNSYSDVENNSYIIKENEILKKTIENKITTYKISVKQGNVFELDDLHYPLELEQILSNFRKSTPFKWLTHSSDKNQFINDYDGFEGFMQQVKDKFHAIENNLKQLSSNLYRKIYDFALNTDIEKSWYSKGDLKIGWSSLEGLKEWCDLGNKPFDFKLKESIVLEDNELIYWKDVVELFKQEIEVRNDSAMLFEFFIEKRKKVRKDTNRVFKLELIDEDCFKNKEFYTDVEKFSNAIDTILEMMTKETRIEYPKIIVSVEETEVEEDKLLDIKIIQIGSFAHRDSDSLEKVATGGDFSKIKEDLRNLCNWSVENKYNDNIYRVDYLKDSSLGAFDSSNNELDGFTHILRFKQR